MNKEELSHVRSAPIRWLILAVLVLPLAASAADKCVPKNDALIEKRKAAVAAAIDAALKRRGWTRVTLEKPRFLATQNELLGRGDVYQPPHDPDAGAAPRYLLVGHIEPWIERATVYAKDKDGNVFQVLPETRFEPTEVVTFCGCAPPEHGGAYMTPPMYGVEMTGNERLREPANAKTEFRVKVKTVEIRYSEVCPPPP